MRADIDMKKAAKLFSNKFATGASVTKNNIGVDELVIQGDVAYEVFFSHSPRAITVL